MRMIMIVIMMIWVVVVTEDPAKDREECTPQLVGLATCLPYVGGKARAPTPDCCDGLKKLLENNKKCLCVIVRDRDDPEFGLQINVTLALSLPSVCHAPATNVSKCPELLNIDPNSKEAQVFYQLERGTSNRSSNTFLPPTPTPTPTPTAGGLTSEKSNGETGKLGWKAVASLLVFKITVFKWFSKS